MAVLLAFGGVLPWPRPPRCRTPGPLCRRPGRDRRADCARRPPASPARVIYPMFDQVGRRLNSLTPTSYLDQVQKLLYQVGPPYRMTAMGFLGMQVGAGLGLCCCCLLWAAREYAARTAVPGCWPRCGPVRRPVLALLLPGAPRHPAQELLLRSLPAALDFLAIMVEAGMGFDAALNELVRRWQNTAHRRIRPAVDRFPDRQAAARRLARSDRAHPAPRTQLLCGRHDAERADGRQYPRPAAHPGRADAHPPAPARRGGSAHRPGQDAGADGPLHLPLAS